MDERVWEGESRAWWIDKRERERERRGDGGDKAVPLLARSHGRPGSRRLGAPPLMRALLSSAPPIPV